MKICRAIVGVIFSTQRCSFWVLVRVCRFWDELRIFFQILQKRSVFFLICKFLREHIRSTFILSWGVIFLNDKECANSPETMWLAQHFCCKKHNDLYDSRVLHVSYARNQLDFWPLLFKYMKPWFFDVANHVISNCTKDWWWNARVTLDTGNEICIAKNALQLNHLY